MRWPRHSPQTKRFRRLTAGTCTRSWAGSRFSEFGQFRTFQIGSTTTCVSVLQEPRWSVAEFPDSRVGTAANDIRVLDEPMTTRSRGYAFSSPRRSVAGERPQCSHRGRCSGIAQQRWLRSPSGPREAPWHAGCANGYLWHPVGAAEAITARRPDAGGTVGDGLGQRSPLSGS
jgi:hypothetical protein